MNSIILTGGRSQRFGGNKIEERIDNKSVLEILIGNLPKSKVIVVGLDTELADICIRETPHFGGPLAGVSAAMPYVDSASVAIFGGDMPFAPMILEQLLPLLNKDGVLPLDDEGVAQPLAALYGSGALQKVFANNENMHNQSMRSLLVKLELDLVEVQHKELLLDIDTPQDLIKAIDLYERMRK